MNLSDHCARRISLSEMMERSFAMRTIDMIYIDGAFVTPHGDDRAPLFNPATEKQIGEVRLGDADDVNLAVAAAKRAFPAMARTSSAERTVMLRRLHKAVAARAEKCKSAPW